MTAGAAGGLSAAMDAEIETPASEADSAAPDTGISAVICDARRLVDDAKTLAQAELAYQSSRAAVAGGAAKAIAIYGLVAAVFVVFGLVALTVGLLLALTPLVTAWGATAIVAGGLVLIALICVKAASARWKRAKAALLAKEVGQ